MGFTPRQQKTYRRVVEDAWKKHAPANGLDRKDKITKEKWYRTILHASLHVWTTKELHPKKHFALACAAFEEIAGGSIYWQMRAVGGSEAELKRRTLHSIRETCRQYDIDESYARSVARQSLQCESLPWIDELKAEQLVTVARALRIHAMRDTVPTDPPEEVITGDEDPF